VIANNKRCSQIAIAAIAASSGNPPGRPEHEKHKVKQTPRSEGTSIPNHSQQKTDR